MRNRFSIRARLRSFVYAWRGMRRLLALEHNAYIHVGASILAVGLGIFFGLAAWEWVAVVLCIGMVFFAEALNTSIEKLADHVTDDYHPEIRDVKDLAAGAVLLAAIAALITGLIIFGPRVWALL